MAALRHLFTGRTRGIRVRVYQQDDVLMGDSGWFYMACANCGACSHHHPDEQEVCQQALNHVEGHETGTA